jgi:hypothetical protein
VSTNAHTRTRSQTLPSTHGPEVVAFRTMHIGGHMATGRGSSETAVSLTCGWLNLHCLAAICPLTRGRKKR